MFDLVLYQPEIPENTGNIVRLCANTGARLHLVLPAGFTLGDRGLRRAGLDYHEFSPVTRHEDWAACAAHFGERRMFAVSTRATLRHDQVAYRDGDVFVFGPESRGLPQSLLDAFDPAQQIRLPMRMETAGRSLNLANAAAVVLYEAWRQNGYAGGR